MKKVLLIIFKIIFIGGLIFAGYFFRQRIINLATFHSIYVPCERPITYAIGSFDPQFGLSQKSFLAAIKEAEAIWEQPLGRDLFAYSDSGDTGELKINLVFDHRQETTVKLDSLGEVVAENQTSYNELKANYQTLSDNYATANANYNSKVTAFNKDQDVYEDEVRSWNKKGGAPKPDYERLQAKQQALTVAAAEIKKLEVGLRQKIDDLNSLAEKLNQLAAKLNITVDQYNKIGGSRGEEFTEGDYQSSIKGQAINVYEFSNHTKLVRLLAHEFGHALGLPHVDDPQAIMYRLNSSANSKLTNADIEALKVRCGLTGASI